MQVRQAIIYARFSSDGQKEGYSIERQTEHARAFIDKMEWQCSGVITDEAKSAFSGKNRREGSALHAFEEEAKKGMHKGTVLVVENLDRLSRMGAKDTAQLIWKLNEFGVGVATFHDSTVYEADSSGDIVNLITMIVKAKLAHEESEKKQKRTNASWSRRFEAIRNNDHAAVIAGRMPPWLTRNDDGSYAVNEHRAAIMRRIFSECIDGTGGYTLARQLNEEKEPVWSKLAVHSEAGWRQSSIVKLLNNRAVLGEYTTQDGELISPDFFPQLIPTSDFVKAQSAMRSRKKSGGSHTRNTYNNLLSNMIYCDECSQKMSFEYKGVRKHLKKTGEMAYYDTKSLKCSANKRSHTCDHSQNFDYPTVEKVVIDTVLIHAVIATDDSAIQTSIRDQIITAQYALDQIYAPIDNLVAVIEAGHASEAIIAKLAAHEKNKARLTAELDDLRQKLDEERAKPSVEADREMVRQLIQDINAEDPSERSENRRKVNLSLARICPAIRFSKNGTFAFVVEGAGGFLFDRNGKRLIAPYQYELKEAELTKG